MHLKAGSVSQKMVMDLTSSAHDICVLYGMCDYLGKIKEDDPESRQDSASIVLIPRVSATASMSRASVADDFSDHASSAEGHFSAPASAVDSDLLTSSARAAEGNLQLIPHRRNRR